MKKLPTGEPYAGKPHVRFGGRGGRKAFSTPISNSLTFKAVHRRSSNVSSHSHERNSTNGRVREPKPHHVGLQISCGFHSEMSAQNVVSGTTTSSGRGFPAPCVTKGIEGRGRASDARSSAHVAVDTPEICGVAGRRVVGYIKGKSAIHLARVYGERKRNFVGQHFWARGFFVNTVGRYEDAIRAYIRNQEKEDQRLEQLNLWR